jgi:hypothetical protein
MIAFSLALGSVEAALASAPRVNASDTTSPTRVYQLSSSITPPRLMKTEDAEFPPGLPRRTGWSATVVVGLVLDQQGNPSMFTLIARGVNHADYCTVQR